jgi:DNA-binding NtrC family response regulator
MSTCCAECKILKTRLLTNEVATVVVSSPRMEYHFPMESLAARYDPATGVHSLEVPAQGDTSSVKLYGTKAWLEALSRDLEVVGPTEAKVVITGETGTGKTTLARAIHLRHRTRGERRFRRTNVGALVPELAASQLFGHVKGAFTGATHDHIGIVEESNGGTFFMDEVSAASETVQVMLLTLLETKRINKVGAGPKHQASEVNVRFIAATTQPLKMLRESKTFRKDLFFRLLEYHIAIPPLRERPEEIPVLAQGELLDCQPTHRVVDDSSTPLQGLEDEAVKRLQAYRWPGNVRELQSVIRAAVVRSRQNPREKVLRAKHISFLTGSDSPANSTANFDENLSWAEAKETFQRQWLQWALEHCGTAAEVGRRFGLDQKTIKKYRRA